MITPKVCFVSFSNNCSGADMKERKRLLQVPKGEVILFFLFFRLHPYLLVMIFDQVFLGSTLSFHRRLRMWALFCASVFLIPKPPLPLNSFGRDI